MGKTFFIGANWKMHPAPAAGEGKNSSYAVKSGMEIVVFPAYTDLAACIGAGTMTVGAQCGQPEDSGARTGDVSMAMLAAAGVTHVLCGHSERRAHHGESDEAVAAQVAAALTHGLVPVLCIGETADQREMDETKDVLRRQISAVTKIAALSPKNCVVAYEPVWAIGTGKTPAPADANTTHAYIKSLLPVGVRVIYGGSVTDKNAATFFREPHIDGALVGGASLKPAEFGAIVSAAEQA